MSYTAFVIDTNQRSNLLNVFVPSEHHTIAHHVTLGMGDVRHKIPTIHSATIVGRLQVTDMDILVVAINGATTRPNGGTYHITWSINKDAGKKPNDSNLCLLSYPNDIVWDINIPINGNVELCK